MNDPRIEIAEALNGMPGTEKWPVLVGFPVGETMDYEVQILPKGKATEAVQSGELIVVFGPWLDANDPDNEPAAFLRRAGVCLLHWVYTHDTGEDEQVVSLVLNSSDISPPKIMDEWPAIPTTLDYMQAIKALAEKVRWEVCSKCMSEQDCPAEGQWRSTCQLENLKEGPFMQAWLRGCGVEEKSSYSKLDAKEKIEILRPKNFGGE